MFERVKRRDSGQALPVACSSLFKFLIDDGEITTQPDGAHVSRHRCPEQPVPILTDDELVRLIAACKGTSLENRRDEAIIRMLIDTGIRASELIGLAVEDVDLGQQIAMVMGKGGRGRAVPYGIRTTDALRRYLKARRQHPLAATTQALWLGRKGPLTVSGVAQLLERRGADAGVDHLHPHRFRHTMAHRWLSAGGQEQDLMRLAGWRTREMVGRYAAALPTDGPGRRTGAWPLVINCDQPGGPWVDPHRSRARRDPTPAAAEQGPHLRGLVQNGDRLFQVVKVQGRPLALARAMRVVGDRVAESAIRRGSTRAPIPLGSRLAGSQLGGVLRAHLGAAEESQFLDTQYDSPGSKTPRRPIRAMTSRAHFASDQLARALISIASLGLRTHCSDPGLSELNQCPSHHRQPATRPAATPIASGWLSEQGATLCARRPAPLPSP